MARYIDADKAKLNLLSLSQSIKHSANISANDIAMTLPMLLDNEPTADVQEVKHGVWIDTEAYTNHYGHIYECSNCHKEVADDFIVKHTYCLHCGAKMDGKENE